MVRADGDAGEAKFSGGVAGGIVGAIKGEGGTGDERIGAIEDCTDEGGSVGADLLAGRAFSLGCLQKNIGERKRRKPGGGGNELIHDDLKDYYAAEVEDVPYCAGVIRAGEKDYVEWVGASRLKWLVRGL